MKNQNLTIKKVQELIASGFLKEALKNFKSFIDVKIKENPHSEKFTELHNSTILLKSKLSNLNKNIKKDVLERDYIDIQESKIP